MRAVSVVLGLCAKPNLNVGHAAAALAHVGECSELGGHAYGFDVGDGVGHEIWLGRGLDLGLRIWHG